MGADIATKGCSISNYSHDEVVKTICSLFLPMGSTIYKDVPIAGQSVDIAITHSASAGQVACIGVCGGTSDLQNIIQKCIDYKSVANAVYIGLPFIPSEEFCVKAASHGFGIIFCDMKELSLKGILPSKHNAFEIVPRIRFLKALSRHDL